MRFIGRIPHRALRAPGSFPGSKRRRLKRPKPPPRLPKHRVDHAGSWLIVCPPPRHLKSYLPSVAFPAWCPGHQPSAEILCVSYAQELADKLSRDCRRLLASDWYQLLFPTRLSPQRAAVPEFETTAQGSRVATSVGGVLTGRGADLIVIDDPLKPEQALSQTQRRAANEWYDHTLYSRLNVVLHD
jgi:hypothetical protein